MEASLWGLLAASFLAATLLPGGSEAVLLALIHYRPQLAWPAVIVATIGNTGGGLTSYWLGRLLPRRIDSRGMRWVERYGAPALLFAWAPVVGDALCVAAGWLRLAWLPVTAFMTAGKLARYAVIAGIAAA